MGKKKQSDYRNLQKKSVKALEKLLSKAQNARDFHLVRNELEERGEDLDEIEARLFPD